MTAAVKKQSRPAQLADEIEALGWVVQRIKNGELREIHASRGDELVSITFVRKHFGGAVQSTRDVFVQARHYAGSGTGVDVDTAAEAVKIVRQPPDVPFALDASDEAVLAAVAGRTVEWVGRITGKAQSGAVPRGGVHLRLVSGLTSRGEAIAPEDRVLHFTDPHGFHAVRLATIVRVS